MQESFKLDIKIDEKTGKKVVQMPSKDESAKWLRELKAQVKSETGRNVTLENNKKNKTTL